MLQVRVVGLVLLVPRLPIIIDPWPRLDRQIFLIDDFSKSGGICETLHLIDDHFKSFNTGCSFTQYVSLPSLLCVCVDDIFLLIPGGVVANVLRIGAVNRC